MELSDQLSHKWSPRISLVRTEALVHFSVGTGTGKVVNIRRHLYSHFRAMPGMAHNRLERIGTIYTRITGLIQSGAMKLEDRPLWYEIYQAFPPETPPRYDNPAPKGEIRKIFFPEDAIRAKFYQKMPSVPGTSLLEDGRASACQTFLDNCRRLADSKGVTMDQVFDEAFANTKEALLALRTESNKVRSEVKTLRAPRKPVGPSAAADIEGIFSEEPTSPPPSTKPT